MKKPNKRWTIRLGAMALSAVLLGTVGALATGGDQGDPLITLSYLNQTAIPQIVKQVEEKTAARQKELEQTFTGGTVNSGAALTKNHLYMATIADRTLTASGDVKLLVRGSYSVA